MLDLRFHAERMIHVAPQVIHQNACSVTFEDAGSGNVTCPPRVDQGLAATHQLDGGLLQLSADDRLDLDGNGCAAGGGVDVTYRLTPDSRPPRDGFVSATFHGCGRVRVLSRE